MLTAAVILILCNGDAGTMTVLENNRHISAQHVGCLANDFEDAQLDFATGPTSKNEGLKFSCERLVTGRKYRLMGYNDQTLIEYEFEATPYVVEVQSLGRKNLRGLSGLALAVLCLTNAMKSSPSFQPATLSII